MLLKMYVQQLFVADHLTCVVPGICDVSEDPVHQASNVFELIFRERHPPRDT